MRAENVADPGLKAMPRYNPVYFGEPRGKAADLEQHEVYLSRESG
jgi:hypothetical protein